jgi:hypothetical protein
MSANELLHEIEVLPKEERLWLWKKLSELREADIPESLRQSMAEAEQADWARFSASQLAGRYAPEDSVYDEE